MKGSTSMCTLGLLRVTIGIWAIWASCGVVGKIFGVHICQIAFFFGARSLGLGIISLILPYLQTNRQEELQRVVILLSVVVDSLDLFVGGLVYKLLANRTFLWLTGAVGLCVLMDLLNAQQTAKRKTI